MIIKDVDLMIRMHENASCCEVCGDSKHKREVHHIKARGIGGGSRLDIGWNLIVVCGSSPADGHIGCHDKCQKGDIPKREQWGIAAEREIRKLLRS